MSRPSLLRLEDKLAAEEAHLRAFGRGDQGKRLAVALALSLAAHVATLLAPAPHAAGEIAPARDRAPFAGVVRWIPAGPEPASRAAPPPARASREVRRETPARSVDGTVPPPERPARLELLAGSEPVPEPPPRVATALPREAETLIGPAVPPPPPAAPVFRAGPAATRPMVAPEGRVEPEYPPVARALRLTGSVLLEVLVNEDGTVGTVEVVAVSRRGVGFEEAAVAAIRKWTFVAATHDGRPVAATTAVEVTFQ